ncbi:hypothetical protein C7120_07240 [Prevotella sp. oral taxon 376]|uniref:hypothetical protein n=1 Tax=Prevotella sp. oral taxon 376 TaxID=712466 RepID=UPI000D1E6D70|nr:hypothetical protein [Prevotella sp. oral taxon 376]PTL34319.1 hypothetical protein C7120_07240 [Prevotella sp. oral taxon 376]
MKIKETYERPMTEIILANISSVMYETSLPQAGDDEIGGDPEAKEGWFDDESAWGIKNYNPWDD